MRKPLLGFELSAGKAQRKLSIGAFFSLKKSKGKQQASKVIIK
jgi:hypothetical protein